MANIGRQLEELRQQHPDKIDMISRDSDGLWLDLRPGWRADKMEYAHAIHCNTVSEMLFAFRDVHPCDCDECRQMTKEAS